VTLINFGFSPGTFVLENSVKLAQCAKVFTGAAHIHGNPKKLFNVISVALK
jgi:hypothetical protein